VKNIVVSNRCGLTTRNGYGQKHFSLLTFHSSLRVSPCDVFLS